jgi:hypothetical protein
MVNLDQKWPVDLLGELRHQGDPMASEIVHNLFVQGDVKAVSDLLNSLVRNDEIPPTGLPPAVYDFLQSMTLPPIDPAQVALGEQFFEQHGNLVLVVLLCASLPECYVMRKGVEVLWLTQRLESHVLRRLLETAQMVVSVLTPGGLGPNGKGVQRAKKVRLMHAAIRHLILCGSTPPPGAAPPCNFGEILLQVHWDKETLGNPINQEDLLYTLLTFSYVIPRGLERLGVEVQPDQKEAFIYCWNIVGTIMGIQTEILPTNYEVAGALFERIKQLEGGTSEPAKAMTAALIRCIRNSLPVHLMDFIPTTFIRQLLDPTTAQWVGLSAPGEMERIAGELLLKEVQGLTHVLDFARGTQMIPKPVWHWFSQRVMHHLLNLGQPAGWQRTLFTLPEHLAARWTSGAEQS